MSIKLNPCPACKADPIITKPPMGDPRSILCQGCGFSLSEDCFAQSGGLPIDRAVRAWNLLGPLKGPTTEQPVGYTEIEIQYRHALEDIKYALNNSRTSDEALHTIGNEVSYALSLPQLPMREAAQPVECREAFEKWYGEYLHKTCGMDADEITESLNRLEDSAYGCIWQGWQAAWNTRQPERELSKEDLAGYKFDTSEYITIGLHPARKRESVSIENAAWAIIRLWEKLGTITWRDMAKVCAKEWGLPITEIDEQGRRGRDD